ncbi:MAG: D-glycero-beta-D-manno-heptose 1-phosphate adenylyltransferase [Desulfocapsa sp.]|nr:MAG: D-glycero-beta-D-manno-heptose 1-phosphate adenylyltransferase [Desulfocapsa sp.]
MSERSISRLGFFQFAVKQGAVQNNLEQVKKGLSELNPPPGSLIALPEMWATGFVYEKLAELSTEIPVLLGILEELAQSYGIILAGSLPCQQVVDGSVQLKNRLCFSGLAADVVPGIDKQHLFSFWKEDQWFVAGKRPQPVALDDDTRIGGLVCYDLRFPDAARLQCVQGADILLMSAQWPMARIGQWRILLQARAIENQCFIIAANACGNWDQLQLGGHSMLVAPDGEILAEAGSAEDFQIHEYNLEVQKELRERFNTVGGSPWMKDDKEKITSLEKLQDEVKYRRRAGQKIVFTNGCFDILHAGHVEYLQKARQQGDFLILGLNNDDSIRSIKGSGRPINKELHRARVLAALSCVDAIVLFGDDTPLNLITGLQPDVLVKGADWEEDEIAGAAEVKAAGGRVERIAFTTRISTTALIEQIKA